MPCRQGEGATHHAGCLCWEERRDAEVAAAERRGYERGVREAVEAARGLVAECVEDANKSPGGEERARATHRTLGARWCAEAVVALLDKGQQPRAKPPVGEEPRHAVNEHGDCASWCRRCDRDRREGQQPREEE